MGSGYNGENFRALNQVERERCAKLTLTQRRLEDIPRWIRLGALFLTADGIGTLEIMRG